MKPKQLFLSVASFMLVITTMAQRPQPTQQTQPTQAVQPVDIKTKQKINIADPRDERIKKLEEENAKLVKDIEELKESMKTLATKVSEAKKDIVDTKITIVGVKYTMGNIQTGLDSLKTSYSTHFHTVNGSVGNGIEDGHVILNKGSSDFSKLVKWAKTTGGPDNK